jgi:hypothetical protein
MPTFITPQNFVLRGQLDFLEQFRQQKILEEQQKKQEEQQDEQRDKAIVGTAVGLGAGILGGAAIGPALGLSKVAGGFIGGGLGAQAGAQFGGGNIAGGAATLGSAGFDLARFSNQQLLQNQAQDHRAELQRRDHAITMQRAGFVPGHTDHQKIRMNELNELSSAIRRSPNISSPQKQAALDNLLREAQDEGIYEQKWIRPKAPSPEAIHEARVFKDQSGIEWITEPDGSIKQNPEQAKDFKFRKEVFSEILQDLVSADAKAAADPLGPRSGKTTPVAELIQQAELMTTAVMTSSDRVGNALVQQREAQARKAAAFERRKQRARSAHVAQIAAQQAGPQAAAPSLAGGPSPTRGGEAAKEFLDAIVKSEGTVDVSKWSENSVRQAVEPSRDILVEMQNKKLLGTLTDQDRKVIKKIIEIMERAKKLEQ